MDRAQEHLHYLMDVAADTVYILEAAEDQSPSSLPGGESGERLTPELRSVVLVWLWSAATRGYPFQMRC